jgi:hypothetical protein
MDVGMVFVLNILFAFVLPIVMIGVWTTHKKEMAKVYADFNNLFQSLICAVIGHHFDVSRIEDLT